MLPMGWAKLLRFRSRRRLCRPPPKCCPYLLSVSVCINLRRRLSLQLQEYGNCAAFRVDVAALGTRSPDKRGFNHASAEICSFAERPRRDTAFKGQGDTQDANNFECR